MESWLGESGLGGASDRDAEGTYDGEYRAVAVDGDTAVAIGTSRYFEAPGGKVTEVFHNAFVMRFDDDARCAEFTEWFMRAP